MLQNRFPRFRIQAFGFVLFVCFVVHSPAADTGNETAPFPTPPMQGKPWTPPETKLAPVVVSAIKELFDQGMADPRGCEYREVEVAPGQEYGQNQKVHAWVLPGEGKARYAVSWNGRVISVLSVGAAVDLKKDFKPDTHGLGPFNGAGWGIYDWKSLPQNSALPIKAALLLRLGKAELAEGVVKDGGGNPASDPYLKMAREWMLSWFNWGAVAHSNGKDQFALETFRALIPLQKTVEAAAARRGISNGLSDFPELGDLPLLAADQERRAKEPPHIPALNAGITDQRERIAALIRDLELASGEDFFGGTDMGWDANVQALIREGDAAVEPLLDCLENDQRLTRAQFSEGDGGMTRAFPDTPPPPGPWVRVYEPAYVALAGILRITPSIPLPAGKNPHELSAEDRKALAAKFRAYWEANKGLTPAERQFAILRDDKATPDEWLRAAGEITQHINEISMPQGMFGGGGGSSFGTDKPLSMRGESLRSKSNPSVSDVLIRRFLQLLGYYRHGGEIDTGTLGNLLRELADWSGTERLDDLRKLTKRFSEEVGYGGSTARIDATVYATRLAHGDTTALAEYAQWLSLLQPGNVPQGDLQSVFEPMWQHPADPAVRKAADAMFGGADSFWLPDREHGLAQLFNTPMLGIAPFRGLVLRALDDATVIGFARRWPGNPNVEVHLNDQGPDNQEKSPPKTDVRVCDYYASQLAAAETFPDFQFDWPLEKRDALVAACKTMLKQYGDAYRFHPYDTQADANRGTGGHTQPAFPRLDHPATPEDVAQGRAIFSLEGKVRTCLMPAFPLYADRPSSKQDPSQGMQMDGNGNSKSVTTYTTDGHVWQAEEVMIGGKWERYYGFAGRHQIEKVPASEIIFPGGWPSVWTRITPCFEGALLVPETKELHNTDYNSYAVTSTETPVTLMCKVHNRSGLDQPVPAALVVPPHAVKTLPGAITLQLSYTEKIAPDITNADALPRQEGFLMGHPPPFDYGAWTELPLKKEVAVADSKKPGPLIGASGDATVLQIDLRDFFDMTRPGTYRLKAVFQAYGLSPDESQYRPENTVTFTVLKKTK